MTAIDRTRSRSVALGAVLGLCLISASTLATEPLRPAHSYSLTTEIKAMAGRNGGLEIIASDMAEPLVSGSLDELIDTRRQRGGDKPLDSFVAFSREGQRGGQRGFSALADDDADGSVDEDRLDGLDNDGDGLIDEDYAAVSDAMTAVHLSRGSGWAQLEFMQWAGTRLQNALFLDFSAVHEFNSSTTVYYRLESGGNPWDEVEVFSRHHNLAGQSETDRATAFVLKVASPVSASRLSDPSSLNAAPEPGTTWVGVLVLDQGDTRHTMRPLLDGTLLSLPLGVDPVPMVICTANSWVQLNRLLIDATLAFQGLQDPVSQRQARWILNPLCSKCRQETTVEFTVESASEDDLALDILLQPGQSGLLDPDLFILGSTALGEPQEITWYPAGGKQAGISWHKASSADFSLLQTMSGDLFRLLEAIPAHAAEGVLNFRFKNPPAEVWEIIRTESAVTLGGVWLDGRSFSCQGQVKSVNSGIRSTSAENQTSPGTAESGRSGKGQLSLSSDLLEGWPNPFRDQIRIEFVVPSTTRELFDWPEDEPLPNGVELSGPVVWSSGQPSVSVKVYSINGQELVSLQSGSLAEGRYSVSWNGTDAFGRQVASGTYFCKLQLDDWSVTRRLVFIR